MSSWWSFRRGKVCVLSHIRLGLSAAFSRSPVLPSLPVDDCAAPARAEPEASGPQRTRPYWGPLLQTRTQQSIFQTIWLLTSRKGTADIPGGKKIGGWIMKIAQSLCICFETTRIRRLVVTRSGFYVLETWRICFTCLSSSSQGPLVNGVHCSHGLEYVPLPTSWLKLSC